MLIRNVHVVNVELESLSRADLLINNGMIQSIVKCGTIAPSPDDFDAHDAFLLPGFIDAHVHIESSHLLPSRFGTELLAHGTTTAICDPHEIVNVAGESALDFMLSDAENSPCDLRFMLPSCVPSTNLETSGASLSAADTERIFSSHPQLLGLGEMMNFPGVLSQNSEVLAKIHAAQKRAKRIDGHFPFGSGNALNQYVASGISSDHESVSASEAAEKVAAGMQVLIREGGSAKNAAAIIPAVTDENVASFSFCVDDVSASYLVEKGDIQEALRQAVAAGLSPLRAIRIATMNTARHYGLNDRGIIKNGLRADLVLVNNLSDFSVECVWKNGILFFPSQLQSPSLPPAIRPPSIVSSVHLPTHAQIQFPPPPSNATKARVLEVLPTEIISPSHEISLTQLSQNSLAKNDIAMLSVVGRYGNGHISYAFAHGTGLFQGAIAQTIAHDSHNIVILGANENDMQCAMERINEIGGGVVVVINGEVIGEFSLPFGGLMTDLSARDAAQRESLLMQAIRKTGITLPSPVITIAFLSLPVIPELKLTDLGLVDVQSFSFVPLYF